MEPSMHQQNPLASLLFLVVIMIPMVFVVNKLAKEKGRNVTLWTVIACIPFINFISIAYIVGAPSKRLEEKMDKIMEALNRMDQK
jgi:preprotein translocase subunit YajC